MTRSRVDLRKIAVVMCLQLDIKKLGLRHIGTRPCTPKSHGKIERFIQTTLREWAYALAYSMSRKSVQRFCGNDMR